MARLGVGAGVLLVAIGTHYALFVWMFFGVCGISDTSNGFPAPASPQGVLCDGHGPWLELILLGGLPLGVLVTVVIAVLWWPTPRRLLGWTSCLWLPLVIGVAFSLPPDACSAEQEDRLRASECDRTPDG